MLEKYLLRPPTIDHCQAVFDLILRCDQRDVGFADSDIEDLQHDWNTINLHTDAWLAIDASGHLRGYAACVPWDDGIQLMIYDDPGTEATDLFQGLLLFSSQRASAILREMNDPLKRSIHLFLYDQASFQNRMVMEAGYSIKKYIFNMHRDLDNDLPKPVFPEGIRIRNAVTGQDETAIHAFVQQAFDWRERTAQPFEEWKDSLMRPEIFDEKLWFMAEQGGELIGTCLCMKRTTMGWIRQLAVKKPLRKLGIGRALLEHAFLVFKDLGFQKAGLAVESENPNAVHFYETAGMFKAVHLNEYVKEIQI